MECRLGYRGTEDTIELIADGFKTSKLKEAKDHHKELVPGHEEPESEDEHVMSDDYDTTVAEEGGQGQPLSMEYSMTIDDSPTQLDANATQDGAVQPALPFPLPAALSACQGACTSRASACSA